MTGLIFFLFTLFGDVFGDFLVIDVNVCLRVRAGGRFLNLCALFFYHFFILVTPEI